MPPRQKKLKRSRKEIESGKCVVRIPPPSPALPQFDIKLRLSSFLQGGHTSSVSQALPAPPLDAYGKALDILRRSKRILVVTGAGISVSCGIPDFRSKNGLYSSSEVADIMLSAGGSPEELFDIDFFRDDPAPFYQLAHKISPGLHQPSWTHFFIVLLEQQKKLLRNFTQNIDGLEHVAGEVHNKSGLEN